MSDLPWTSSEGGWLCAETWQKWGGWLYEWRESSPGRGAGTFRDPEHCIPIGVTTETLGAVRFLWLIKDPSISGLQVRKDWNYAWKGVVNSKWHIDIRCCLVSSKWALEIAFIINSNSLKFSKDFLFKETQLWQNVYDTGTLTWLPHLQINEQRNW